MISVMVGVLEQRLDRSESEDLGRDRLEQAQALDARQGDTLGLEDRGEGLLDSASDFVGVAEVHARIEFGDQPVLDADLHFIEESCFVVPRAALRLLGLFRQRAGLAWGVWKRSPVDRRGHLPVGVHERDHRSRPSPSRAAGLPDVTARRQSADAAAGRRVFRIESFEQRHSEASALLEPDQVPASPER